MTTRNCDYCGEPFAAQREHARFCSARCRVAWNRGTSSVTRNTGWADLERTLDQVTDIIRGATEQLEAGNLGASKDETQQLVEEISAALDDLASSVTRNTAEVEVAQHQCPNCGRMHEDGRRFKL
jgi:endogenous inhibitor of DNA gyrase (YacG/DUF329 family)